MSTLANRAVHLDRATQYLYNILYDLQLNPIILPQLISTDAFVRLRVP